MPMCPLNAGRHDALNEDLRTPTVKAKTSRQRSKKKRAWMPETWPISS